MALQRVPNLIISTPSGLVSPGLGGTMDAAGESNAVIGYVCLENGDASTKTISSSGGKIYWRAGTTTFGNSGTNLRIGIQDVSATTGLEDNTFDVQADLVGGTDTITSNTFLATAMESGTKTIGHGQLIAIVWEMTARVTDSVVIQRNTQSALFSSTSIGPVPYGTADVGGAGLAKNASFPFAMIEFDDGTVGWIHGTGLTTTGATRVSYAANSTPDEYCAVFTPTFTCEIDGMCVDVSEVDSGEDFEVILYTDPLGTPSNTSTVTPDPDQTFVTGPGNAAGMIYIPPITLTAGVTYGVAVRPATNNALSFGYLDFGSGFEKLKRMSCFGSTLKIASRTNQTGAFTEVQTYQCPSIFLRISKLDDGVSTGGSAANFRSYGGYVYG